jgi:hypothetical protein
MLEERRSRHLDSVAHLDRDPWKFITTQYYAYQPLSSPSCPKISSRLLSWLKFDAFTITLGTGSVICIFTVHSSSRLVGRGLSVVSLAFSGTG